MLLVKMPPSKASAKAATAAERWPVHCAFDPLSILVAARWLFGASSWSSMSLRSAPHALVSVRLTVSLWGWAQHPLMATKPRTDGLRGRYRRAMDKIALQAAADELTEFWSQQVIGVANGNLFKVAKGIGSTNWHAHADQDETFVILRGHLTIQLRTENVELDAGDLFVVPRGVEHCPHADNEVHFLVIGPDVTSNVVGGKPAWSYASV